LTGIVKRKRVRRLVILVCAFFLFASPRNLFAGDVENVSYVERGFSRILTSAFQLPRYLIQRTFTGPPIIGTLDGALSGTFYTVSELSGGLFDIVRGVIPYAKYLIFFI
jgi:hypothetical protein